MKARLLTLLATLVLSPARSYCAAGRIVLVGGGPMTEEVRRQCWQGTPGRLLVVTAATKDPKQSPEEWAKLNEGTWDEWKADMTRRCKAAGAASVDFIDEKDAKAASAQLRGADALWFSGGDQSEITKAYPPGSDLYQAMMKRYQAGMSICGTSAGTAMAGDLMPTDDPVDGKASVGKGMGFLPGAIVETHYLFWGRQERLGLAVAQHPDHVGIGVDASAAIKVEDGRLTVLAGTVVIMRADGRNDPFTLNLAAGDTWRLKAARSLSERKVKPLGLPAVTGFE